MLIWFAVTSVLLVAMVFRSPGIDYRWVIAGAVLPLVEAVFGGPRVLHALVGPVLLLAVAVLGTRRRRLLRRRVLGLPIGMMTHLILDGSFTRPDVFWWPFRGGGFASGQVPELTHLGGSLALEVVGLAIGVWAWRWLGLTDPAARRRFLTDGRLDVPGQ